MNNKARRDAQLPYIADREIMAEQRMTRRLLQRLNTADYDDFELHREIAREIFGEAGENLTIVPPFFCDYGFHIKAGDHFFANYNCTILDVAEVKIGHHVMLAPNVSVYTAGHPLHPVSRSFGYEYGIAVEIGNHVWIGGNTVIMPGVRIGDNVVIGAGSVVTKDIPSNVAAAGNPCRVIKEITEADKKYYYRKNEFDEEAWGKICEYENGI